MGSPFADTAFRVPAATLDACGPDFPDDNGAPLTLVAFIQTGDAKAKVVIDVVYPDLPVPVNQSFIGAATQRIVPTAFQEVWAIRQRSIRL